MITTNLKSSPPSTQTVQHKNNGLLGWWYNLTTPPEPAANAPLEQRELYRRARLSSIILLILFLLTIPSAIEGIFGLNRMLLYILVVFVAATLAATALNKLGRVTLAGLVIVITYTAGMMVNILTTPDGLTPELIPVFMILLIPEIMAAAMVSTRFVFVSAIVNIVFGFLAIKFMFHNIALDPYMPVIYTNAGVLPATLQAVIAGVSFLWGTNLEKAVRERDQAKEIARLERDLSEQNALMARQKEQLEHSIAMIVHTQSQVANGELNARVPLTPDNVLWSVGGALNNLIARLQRNYIIEQELEHTKHSAAHLVSIIRQRKVGRPAAHYGRTGTVIDTVAMEVLTSSQSLHPTDKNTPIPR